jgi:hypothetical protein
MIMKFSPGEVRCVPFLIWGPKYMFYLLTVIKIIILQTAAGNIINMLWQLMENSLEELKLLQTVLVLLTTNTVVHDEALSKVGYMFV